MDVIKLADYIIDIDQKVEKARQLIAKGTPEEIIKNKKLYGAILEKERFSILEP
jgi:excinuclease ABC subunit A